MQNLNTKIQAQQAYKQENQSVLSRILIALLLCCALVLGGCSTADSADTSGDASTTTEAVENATPESDASDSENAANSDNANQEAAQSAAIDLNTIPKFNGSDPYVEINNNKPSFSKKEISTAKEAVKKASAGNKKAVTSLEKYSALDSEGRCGAACAVVGTETMPTGERGSIGEVKPTGWHLAKYDFVDGKYLYNRCHLIAWMLAGENANTKNLITGTRYLNVEGMLPFEEQVDNYVERTGNHVLYRATPIFKDEELIARGVQLEAYSVEDSGKGVSFNVYCYNAQPGVTINYKTGDNASDGTQKAASSSSKSSSSASKSSKSSVNSSSSSSKATTSTYVLNTNTKKFHNPSCSSVSDMSNSNKREFKGSRDELIDKGYTPCKRCNP